MVGNVAAGSMLLGLGLVSFGVGTGVTLLVANIYPALAGLVVAFESAKAAKKRFGVAADAMSSKPGFTSSEALATPLAKSGPIARGYGDHHGGDSSQPLAVILPVASFGTPDSFADYFFRNVARLFSNAGLVRVPDDLWNPTTFQKCAVGARGPLQHECASRCEILGLGSMPPALWVHGARCTGEARSSARWVVPHAPGSALLIGPERWCTCSAPAPRRPRECLSVH